MKRTVSKLVSFVILCLAATANALAATYTVDQIPNVHLEDSTKFVSNPDGILSPAAVAQINSEILRMWRQTTTEFVVVAVDDIDPQDIDGFATDLFTHWGIGKRDKDNGVLMLVVKDMRRAVIRTGYGAEGALPDIICGRILRDYMFPDFKEGNYSAGVMAGVAQVDSVLTNPEYADELRSKYPNNAREQGDEDFWGFFFGYLGLFLIVGLVLLAVEYSIYGQRKNSPTQAYASLKKLKMPVGIVSALGLGIPLIAYFPLLSLMNKIRNAPRRCPNCGEEMHKLDEETDNKYLNTAQDMEEQLNSVDYDVWLCPKCGETDVIPFVNDESQYEQCPKCGARACQPVSDRIVVRPTATRPGKGVVTYQCQHCKSVYNKEYEVPPTGGGNSAAAAAAAGAILGSALGRRGGGFGGGFGGGGFGGGSFGGGSTGGGGASGGW